MAFALFLAGIIDLTMAGLWAQDGSVAWALFSGVMGVLCFYLAATT